MRMPLIALALLGLAAAAPARAATTYVFDLETAGTDPGAPYDVVSVEGSLSLAIDEGPFGLADVTAFAFSVNGAPPLGLGPFVPCPGCPPLVPEISGQAVAGLLVSGVLHVETGFDFLHMTGDVLGLWTGFFVTDDPRFGCNFTDFPCRFTGVWRAVPEPAPLALLLAALAGLGGRRLWARRAGGRILGGRDGAAHRAPRPPREEPRPCSRSTSCAASAS